METAAETKPEGDMVGKHPVRDVPVDDNAGAVPDHTDQDCNSKAPIEDVFGTFGSNDVIQVFVGL